MKTVELPSVKKGNTKISLKTKVARALWNAAWFFLFRPTPKYVGNSWRIFLLKCFGAKISQDVMILPTCKILQPWRLKMGRSAVIGAYAEIYNFDWIEIGESSVVSQYTFLCTGTHDYTQKDFPLFWKPITVGANCWIAAGAFIAPGITIGDGSVIGAYSVVTKNMPEWMVCAGNPCQPIKKRELQDAQ